MLHVPAALAGGQGAGSRPGCVEILVRPLFRAVKEIQTEQSAPVLEARDVIGVVPAHICNQSGSFVRQKTAPAAGAVALGGKRRRRQNNSSLSPSTCTCVGGEQDPFVWKMDHGWDCEAPGGGCRHLVVRIMT